ncbi:unnamed protein product [Rotaria socialis]|uniref:Uncharacterized protein n=1 Tax=Rotaria socialis TaxID=392032 RepID=A0A818H851_9BILA|nr:unnamed protein product [Rotaria socialis]
MWNVNDLKFRTNNACECIKSSLMDGTTISTHKFSYLAWHARFASRIITKHPHIWRLIDALCNEEFNFLVRKYQLKGGAHDFKLKGLANICALSSQYRGMEYPCANIDMQDRLISLVNAGIPDGKSELELKNNGFKSGRAYKLIQKEQQQLLNVVENSEFFQQKKEIDHILYKALQPLKVRCNSVINLANKHMTWNPRKTDNDDVRLSDSANEEVKNPGEEDQETREQLYQDLDAEINDDQTSTVDIPEANNSSDSQEQYVSLVFIFLHYCINLPVNFISIILQNRQRSSSTKNVIGVSSEPYLDLIFNPFNKRQWNYLSLDHLLDYLIIRVTDKGNNFYIDSVGEFEQKAGKFFSDTNAFIELSYNPFNEILNKVIQLLNTLRGKDLIRKWQYEQMMPDRTKCELAHLYFNPKTHKDGIPVRPIESTIHAANTKISKFFDKILRPIFDYKCKDTTIIDVLL